MIGRRSPGARPAVRRPGPALFAMLAPLLLAATDPMGDVAPCPDLAGGSATGVQAGAPDLVSASGEIVELGTSVRFTLRFAEPLLVPDAAGKPLRIDVVLFDPDVPAVNAGIYRKVNRILRYDAVRDPVTTTLLLPEGGQSRFLPPTIDGASFVVQVPGRTLVADEDETGTAPKLGPLRWGVVVRDEGACDLLGSGRPSEGLVERTSAAAAPPAAQPAWGGTSSIMWLIVGGAALVGGIAYLVRLRVRNAR